MGINRRTGLRAVGNTFETDFISAHEDKYIVAKNLLLSSFNETLETQLEKESMNLAKMAGTADAREAPALQQPFKRQL